jgi:dTDP-4-dehydrorhamnose 3,5-epimerase
MNFTPLPLPGAYRIGLTPHRDERGLFARTWCQAEFEAHGLRPRIVQVNLSRSAKQGTLRGLHYQAAPFEEAKLVRCTRGVIWDVIVDVRPSSPAYCQWVGLELSADNDTLAYVPEGCAHGFVTLQDDVEVTYQVSQAYTPSAERGLRWNDPTFCVEWPTAITVISDKDAHWPDFVG